jgi:hypothetical protein
MSSFDFISGIAIVIDDRIGQADDINNLISQLTNNNIPYIGFTSLPDIEICKNFHDIAFVLLDWRLINEISEDTILEGLDIPDILTSANVDFIKQLSSICFAPIFIFTNESVDVVKSKLISEHLYKEDSTNYIFIKAKSELKGRTRLMNVISDWIKNTPSIYVLKEWEREYRKAKTKLFFDFYDNSPSWPRIMWENYETDGTNPSTELGDTITRNINSRMTPFQFNDKYIKRKYQKEPGTILKVLDGAKYIKNENLDPDSINSGDLFFGKITETGDDFYWLNIRADCDLVARNSTDRDKIELYCLKGRVVDKSQVNKNGISFKDGQFIEKINHAIINSLDGNVIVEFLFRDLKIIKWQQFKNLRKGRLLQPYLSRIQQRYALYLHRHGLPRIPDILIK